MSSNVEEKVKKRINKNYVNIIHTLDPKMMLTHLRQTGILTVAGYDSYYEELNNMPTHGKTKQEINIRLLEVLYTRDKWWRPFFRALRQCEHRNIIAILEGALSQEELNRLRQEIEEAGQPRRNRTQRQRRSERIVSNRRDWQPSDSESDQGPHSEELNNMPTHGKTKQEINIRLPEVLYTREKWWRRFFRALYQCEHRNIIAILEGALSQEELNLLRQEIEEAGQPRRNRTQRQRRSERIVSNRRDWQPSDSESDQGPHSVSATYHPLPAPRSRRRTSHEADQAETGQNSPRQFRSDCYAAPEPLPTPRNDVQEVTQQNSPRQFRSDCYAAPEPLPTPRNDVREVTRQNSPRQFRSDCYAAPEPLPTPRNDVREVTRQNSPRQFRSDCYAAPEPLPTPRNDVREVTRQNSPRQFRSDCYAAPEPQMNSDIGRSPGSLIDEETIDIQKAENNFSDVFKDFTISKKDTDKTCPIILNIPVRADNAVDPNSNITTGDESKMHKDSNLSLLENNTLQSYPGEGESDTRTFNDDVTKEWKHDPHPSFHNHPIDSHHDDRESEVKEKVMQSSPAMDRSNMAPYVSNLIIQSQLDQQRKHDGAALGQDTLIVEFPSTEGLEVELAKEKGRHRVPGSQYHHPKEHYHTESTSVKSHFDEKTHCDPQYKEINTEMDYQEEPALAGTQADCDIPGLSGPVDVSGNAYPVGNIPHFGLIEGETSQNVMSDLPGHDRLHIADNGTYLAEPYNVMSDKKSSRGSTCTQPVNVRTTTPQQANSPLRETSDGSVRLSSHYQPGFGDSPVPNYTHIEPPVHIVSMSETSEPPPIHEALAEMTLTRKMDGASTVTPR